MRDFRDCLLEQNVSPFLIDTGTDGWMPEHYRNLKRAALKYAGGYNVTPANWGLTIEIRPEPHVKHLSSGASKYRLAALCKGLASVEHQATELKPVSATYLNQYSAQLIVMLSFVALEAHLRMRNLKWQAFNLRSLGVDVEGRARLVREDLGKRAFSKLRKAMSDERLRKRLEDFWEGNDDEILAVLSSVRNAFAHGKLGISHSVSLGCARDLRTFLLTTIDSDICMIIKSLETQQT